MWSINSGMVCLIQSAVREAKGSIPFKTTVIGIYGEILEEKEMSE
jgi:hypothetical protein